MTVKQLIKKLEKEDPNCIVVMAHDPEGNGYTPLYNYWRGAYNDEDGEVGLESLDDDDIEAGYSEGDVVKGKPAIILVPS